MCVHAYHHACMQCGHGHPCIFSRQTPVANKEGLISLLRDGTVFQQSPSCTAISLLSYSSIVPRRQDEWLNDNTHCTLPALLYLIWSHRMWPCLLHHSPASESLLICSILQKSKNNDLAQLYIICHKVIKLWLIFEAGINGKIYHTLRPNWA